MAEDRGSFGHSRGHREVVVTVASAGTASPGAANAEAAVVTAAAGEMAGASGSVVAAEATAAEGLFAATRLAASVQAMRSIVVPRLVVVAMQSPVWVETPIGARTVGAATTASLEWLEDGQIAWGDVGLHNHNEHDDVREPGEFDDDQLRDSVREKLSLWDSGEYDPETMW